MRLPPITRFSHFETEGQTQPPQACLSRSGALPCDNSANQQPSLSQWVPDPGSRLHLNILPSHGFENACNQAQKMEEPARVEAQQEKNRNSRGLIDGGCHHAHEHHVEDGVVQLQVPLDGQDEHPRHRLHRHHRHGACSRYIGQVGASGTWRESDSRRWQEETTNEFRSPDPRAAALSLRHHGRAEQSSDEQTNFFWVSFSRQITGKACSV